METIVIIFIGLAILLKVSKIIRNLALALVSFVVSILGTFLIFKWIIKPLFKGIEWICLRIGESMQWIGDKIIDHYSYRDNNEYWYLVANSKDRNAGNLKLRTIIY